MCRQKRLNVFLFPSKHAPSKLLSLYGSHSVEDVMVAQRFLKENGLLLYFTELGSMETLLRWRL